MAIKDNEPYMTPQEAREAGLPWQPRETDVLSELDDPYARESLEKTGQATDDIRRSWTERDDFFGGPAGTEFSADQSSRTGSIVGRRKPSGWTDEGTPLEGDWRVPRIGRPSGGGVRNAVDLDEIIKDLKSPSQYEGPREGGTYSEFAGEPPLPPGVPPGSTPTNAGINPQARAWITPDGRLIMGWVDDTGQVRVTG